MRPSGFSSQRQASRDAAAYPLAADLVRPGGRVSMPCLPRHQAPGYTVHVVGRSNNRELRFTTPEDFGLLIARLGEMCRTHEVLLYAYTLMSEDNAPGRMPRIL